MAWAPLAIAGVQAVGGMMGNKAASKSAKEAQRIRDKAAEEIYGLEVPDLEDLQYTADKNTYAGDVDPTLVSNLGDISSEYNNITNDPRFATAQYQSLGALDDVISGGGMTQADRLLASNAMNDASAQTARDQGAITRDLAERGLGGSGMELAMRLQSQQGAANTQANAAQQQAATAQQRALDAIMQRGNMASGMQDQSFNQQSKAASAKDLINQFNKQNAYNVNENNSAIQNTAQTRNLDARQALTNGNTAISNTNKQANVDAVNQRFGHQMDKANAGANAATGQAASRTAQAESTKNMYAGIGQAAAGAGSAYMDINKSNAKNNAGLNGEELDAQPWYKKI